MSNNQGVAGHTYTPVLAHDGETAYLDSIDTKQLTGGIAETQLSSNAVNDDFSNNDQGPTSSCPRPLKIPDLKKFIPKRPPAKGGKRHKLSATKTEPPANNQPLIPQQAKLDNATPKQGTVQRNEPTPAPPPESPLEKLDAFFDPVGPQLKAINILVDRFSPHYDPTKPGEGIRVIGDSYIYLGGGKLFGWLVGKFGPNLGPLLPKITQRTPKINPEEEIVWVRTNTKGISVIYREFEDAFYGQGNGEFLKYSEALAKNAVEKLEQYYKIRGITYQLAPK